MTAEKRQDNKTNEKKLQGKMMPNPQQESLLFYTPNNGILHGLIPEAAEDCIKS